MHTLSPILTQLSLLEDVFHPPSYAIHIRRDTPVQSRSANQQVTVLTNDEQFFYGLAHFIHRLSFIYFHWFTWTLFFVSFRFTDRMWHGSLFRKAHAARVYG